MSLEGILAQRWLDEHLGVTGALGEQLEAIRAAMGTMDGAGLAEAVRELSGRVAALEARLETHEVIDMAEHQDLAEDVADAEAAADQAEAEAVADAVEDAVADAIEEAEPEPEPMTDEPTPEEIVAGLEAESEQQGPERVPWFARKIGG
ncbi:MAG: hypothetical protein KGJ45_11845 [Elusimicrobia bacterium]|nr:hypothetical protein [Elusimicrobiota bacterium]